MAKNKQQATITLNNSSLIQDLMFIQEITQEKRFVRVVYKLLEIGIKEYKKTPQYQRELNKHQLMQERKQQLAEEAETEVMSNKDRTIQGLIAFVEKYDK